MKQPKYITVNVLMNAVTAPGSMVEIVSEKLPTGYNQVAGIAFFEAANANDLDYELRVSDKNEVHQDYTTKYDFLSIIKGTNIKNVGFNDYYKAYAIPSEGNKVIVSIKHITGIAGGQNINLKVVIKVV